MRKESLDLPLAPTARNLHLPRPDSWLTAALVLTVVGGGCRQTPNEQQSTAPSANASAVSGDPACAGRAEGKQFCEKRLVRVCEGGRVRTIKECWNIERCDPKGSCAPACPPGEVYIPATGKDGFTMGKGRLGTRDTPHKVVLTKPFCMDETEVTAGAYGACVRAGKCEEPKPGDAWSSYPRYPSHPVNMVSWTKAKAYCEFVEKSLPTEAQWEWAATGGDGREWPWGNEPPTCENGLADFTPFGAPKSRPGGDVGCHGGGPSDVKAHPKGAKEWPTGKIYDLAGNVWEWTLDFAFPYPSEAQVDPVIREVPNRPDMTVHTIRGGGWNRSHLGVSTWFRGEATRGYQVPGLGVRCIRPARASAGRASASEGASPPTLPLVATPDARASASEGASPNKATAPNPSSRPTPSAGSSR